MPSWKWMKTAIEHHWHFSTFSPLSTASTFLSTWIPQRKDRLKEAHLNVGNTVQLLEKWQNCHLSSVLPLNGTIKGSGLKCLYTGAPLITLTLLNLYWGSVE